MNGALKVFVKDLSDLFSDFRWLFAFVLPLLVMILVAKLDLRPPAFRLLLAGMPDCGNTTNFDAPVCRAHRLLTQLSSVTVTSEPELTLAPLRAMDTGEFDAVLQFAPDQPDPQFYLAGSDPYRVKAFMSFASSLEDELKIESQEKELDDKKRDVQTLVGSLAAFQRICNDAEVNRGSSGSAGVPSPSDSGLLAEFQRNCNVIGANGTNNTTTRALPQDDDSSRAAAREAERQTVALVNVASTSARLYFPEALDKTRSYLPMSVAIIVCFVPFVLASMSLPREVEAHTLEVLLGVPGIRPMTLFVGKCLLPVVVAVIEFVLMIALAQFVFQLYLKSYILTMILVMLPEILSSVLLGMIVSTVVGSQAQSAIASAAYLFALILLTGCIFPIEQNPAFVQDLAKLFSLTFLRPALNCWMLADGRICNMRSLIGWSLSQCAVYSGIAVTAYRHMLRNI